MSKLYTQYIVVSTYYTNYFNATLIKCSEKLSIRKHSTLVFCTCMEVPLLLTTLNEMYVKKIRTINKVKYMYNIYCD